MRAAYIYASPNGSVFVNDRSISTDLDLKSLRKMRVHQVEKSAFRNLVVHLQRAGVLTSFEDWKFWRGPTTRVERADAIPGVRLFYADSQLRSDDLVAHVREHGSPDIVFVDGHDYGPHLELVFSLCPDAVKVVYSRSWKPWKVERLRLYDVCFVDSPWQIQRVNRVAPDVHAALWWKLIEYERGHHPTGRPKEFDICYLAQQSKRKNHALLFESMAKLRDRGRDLTCVCVGGDARGVRPDLKRLVERLAISVTWVDQLAKADVNEWVNKARIGVMCSERDTIPRAILEYMAADVPVVVNAGLWSGLWYVKPEAGIVAQPKDFADAIAQALDNLDTFSPRAYLLENFSAERCVARFVEIMAEAGHPVPQAV